MSSMQYISTKDEEIIKYSHTGRYCLQISKIHFHLPSRSEILKESILPISPSTQFRFPFNLHYARPISFKTRQTFEKAFLKAVTVLKEQFYFPCVNIFNKTPR